MAIDAQVSRMRGQNIPLWVPGDWNAFFGLFTNVILNVLVPFASATAGWWKAFCIRGRSPRERTPTSPATVAGARTSNELSGHDQAV